MRKLALALLLALLLTNIARADLPTPLKDFTQLTPDGQFIFVMLAKDNGDNFSITGIREVPEIRAVYSQSGLYSASDPTQMLYSVDWNASWIMLSNNGEYLVRWGAWASDKNFQEMALEFYHQGNLLKSYVVADLTNRYDTFDYSISHYTWRESTEFNLKKNQVHLTLISGERFIFDATTGEISEKDGSKALPWQAFNKLHNYHASDYVLNNQHLMEQIQQETIRQEQAKRAATWRTVGISLAGIMLIGATIRFVRQRRALRGQDDA